MRKAAHLLISTVLAFFICWPVPAAAETITALYDVRVSERRSLAPVGFPLEPFEQRFLLRMSLDPIVRDLEGVIDIGPIMFSYGSNVSFSPVPIPSEFALPDLQLSTFATTLHGSIASGTWELLEPQFAYVAQGGSAVLDDGRFLYSTSIDMLNWLHTVANPIFTPETFPSHLGLGDNPLNFRYFETVQDRSDLGGGYLQGSYMYSGTATLVESAIVPEPMTLALVTGGLAILARRRHKTVTY